MTTDTADITDDDNFHVILMSHAHISSVETAGTGDFWTKSKKPIDHVALASRWMMSPEKALQTINVMTQRGVRTCLNPTLSRRVPTNDRHLRDRCLPADLFTDTLIAGTTSKHGNKNTQVFNARNGWTRAYPMARKGEAHEALSLLFHRDGVPPVMVVDGSKEQTSTEF